MGPELCGWGGDKGNPYELYRPSYVDASQPGKPLLAADQQPACWAYDPSVDGRFKLYVASMRDLLNPAQRIPKATKLDQDIVLDIGPRIFDGNEEKRLVGFTVRVPAGRHRRQRRQLPAQGTSSCDLVQAKLHPDALEARLAGLCCPPIRPGSSRPRCRPSARPSWPTPTGWSRSSRKPVPARPALWQVYSSCSAEIENDGHRFGEDLSEADKNALIAFLATL